MLIHNESPDGLFLVGNSLTAPVLKIDDFMYKMQWTFYFVSVGIQKLIFNNQLCQI